MTWNSLPMSAAGSLAVSAVALFFVTFQGLTFITRKSAPNGWAALFSISTAGYAFFVFLEYLAPANGIERILDQAQASFLILMAHSLCGYTFSSLRIRSVLYHWIGGTINAASLALLWLTDLVFGRRLVSLSFLWVPRPFRISELGPLGAAIIAYVVASCLFAAAFWIFRKSPEGGANRVFGIGLLVFVAFGIHDALATLGVIHTVQLLLEYGLLAFSTTILYLTVREYVRLESQAAALERVNRELALIARIDSLTKLANRYGFDQQFEKDWRTLQRRRRQRGLSRSFTLLLCDVDFFKGYNDNYGHPAGDKCLIAVASVLAKNARRSSDFASRYGGDEFAVLLPGTPLEGGRGIAEAILQDVHALGLEHKESAVAPCVTVSIGVSSILLTDDARREELVLQADRALYRAKTRGRNRVEAIDIGEPVAGGPG